MRGSKRSSEIQCFQEIGDGEKTILTGKCPVSPALEGGVKGHNIKGKYHTGESRPLGRGVSLATAPLIERKQEGIGT
jgi:hypothetical protein